MPTPPALQQQFEALSDYVQDAADRLDAARWRPPSSGSTARSPTARWSATTPTARCPAASRPRSRCSTPTAPGVVLSSIHHRDQARLYAKQVHDGQAELELSPEEDEAIRLALEGDAASRRPAVAVAGMRPADARRLLRPRGHVHPRGAARRGARRPSSSSCRCPTIYDTVMAVHDGAVERALVPIENSLEGSVNATLDALAMETEDVAILGEVVHPIRALPDRARPRSSWPRSRSSSPIRRPPPSARASSARGCRARRCCPAARPPRRSGRWPSTTGPWAALGNAARGRALRLPGAARRGRGRRRQRDPVRRGSDRAGAPPGGPGSAGSATRPVEDRDRVLGASAPRRRAGSSAACRSSPAGRST